MLADTSGEEEEEAPVLRRLDLSSVGLMEVEGTETPAVRVSLGKMKHNRYGRPLSSVVSSVPLLPDFCVSGGFPYF